MIDLLSQLCLVSQCLWTVTCATGRGLSPVGVAYEYNFKANISVETSKMRSYIPAQTSVRIESSLRNSI